MFNHQHIALDRVLQWHAGETPRPGPDRIICFPTNRCNLRCVHCWLRWADDYDKTYKSELSDDRLIELVDEGAELGVRQWFFVGGGEPTVRGKVLMRVFEKIRAHGMEGAVHSNGTLFADHMLEWFVDNGWMEVWVSLDGPNAEINNSIRSGGFDKAVGALGRLSELKRKHGVSAPRLVINAAITNRTWDRVAEFVDLAHSIGPDVNMQFCGLMVDGPGAAELALTPEQKEEYPKYVREAEARAEELGVANNFPSHLDTEYNYDQSDMHRGYVFHPEAGMPESMCFEPYSTLAIMPNGHAGPCCVFFGQDAGAQSLADMSMRALWEGPYLEQVRKSMYAGKTPVYCRRCLPNLYVEKEAIRRNATAMMRWREKSPPQKIAHLAARGAEKLRQGGLRETLQHAARWIDLHVKAGHDPSSHS